MWFSFFRSNSNLQTFTREIVLSRFLVTPCNKFIKLSLIFVYYPISSLRNRFPLVGTYEVVDCHNDLKAEYFSECFLAQYSHIQYLYVPSQLLEGKKMPEFLFFSVLMLSINFFRTKFEGDFPIPILEM